MDRKEYPRRRDRKDLGGIREDRKDLVRGIGTRQREASTSCFSIASAINLCTRSVGWPESDYQKNEEKEEGVGEGQVVSLVFVRVVE